MNDEIKVILEASDADIKKMFEEHCVAMEEQGLKDIKFCLKGYDSLEAVQRQILLIEKMDNLGQTQVLDSDFQIFNENYSEVVW